jgi:hypothetical protein
VSDEAMLSGRPGGPSPRALALAGQRFGRLVAIERQGRINKGAAWLCLCDCGQRSVVAASDLARGRTKSCGCAPRGWAALCGREKGPGKVRGVDRPLPCRTCANWTPNPAAELRGECAAGAFLRGRPWSGRCPWQAPGGAA